MDNENSTRLRKAADYYAGLGWNILPVHGLVNGRCTCATTHTDEKEWGKHPAVKEWNSLSTNDVAQIDAWWTQNPDYNIGVHCKKSGFFVIDIDPRSGGPDSFVEFEKLVEGGLPKTIEATTGIYRTAETEGERGRHLYFKCDDEELLIGNLSSLGLKGIDIKHNGYVLAAPSQHFSGVTYEWVAGHEPWVTEMAEAPEALLEVLRKRAKRTNYSLDKGSWESIDYKRIDVQGMLDTEIHEGSRAVDIYQLACALANRFGTDEMARQMIESEMIRFNAVMVHPPLEVEGTNGLLQHVHRAIDFVADNPKIAYKSPYTAEWLDQQAKNLSPKANAPEAESVVSAPVKTIVNDSPSGRIGTSIKDALEAGASIDSASSSFVMNVPKDVDAISEQDGGTPGMRTFSDTGNGRRLVDSFGPGCRYTTGLGWFVWKEGYWMTDGESLELQELAKKLPVIIAAETAAYDDPAKQGEVIKWANMSRSNAKIKGTIDSAKSDPRVVVPVDTWDSDESLLGVRNGVVDLRSGKLLKGRPDLHITRRATVQYIPGQRNVRWEAFLEHVTGGDEEYADWLQKAVGYTITGSNKYDIMFLAYGPAGSGKNTFVETVVKALGTQQYAWPLDSSILAQNDGQANGSDLYHWAQLRGRRMVWVDELPDGERVKENSIKKLTGSSEISARSPGEDPFTFQSQAKLWITTNHRPMVNDDAMWRRIRPIPIMNVPKVPDPGLKEYLFDPEGGLPAVLAWAVEGAMKFYNSKDADALGWCKVVADAASIYRQSEDRIGIFLSEETQDAPGESIPMRTLFMIYRVWSEERGERPMTQIAFQKKLVERGLNVVGVGSRASVFDRSQISHTSNRTEPDVNFATQLRIAKS